MAEYSDDPDFGVTITEAQLPLSLSQKCTHFNLDFLQLYLGWLILLERSNLPVAATLVRAAILTLASRQTGKPALSNCKIASQALTVRQTGCHEQPGSAPNGQVSRQSEEEKSELDIDAARHVV